MKSIKVTADSKARAHWYDDACGTALAMELIGERWSLLIVRELMFGARRFSELRAGLPGISANVLTQRLEGLSRAGIVKRLALPSPVNATAYELTPWGLEAEEAIQSLGRWAARSPDHDPTLPLSAASLMMSFRTMFDPALAPRAPLRIGFRLGRDSFVAEVADGRLTTTRVPAAAGEAVFEATPETMAAIVYGKMPVEDAEAAGLMRFDGNRDAAAAFIALFHLPEKAAKPVTAG
jgi:DNA-binding HxlR family transcriptional regulator